MAEILIPKGEYVVVEDYTALREWPEFKEELLERPLLVSHSITTDEITTILENNRYTINFEVNYLHPYKDFKFKIGDEVIFNGKGNYRNNENTGNSGYYHIPVKITKVSYYGGRKWYGTKESGTNWYSEDALELANKPVESSEPFKFNIGDIVTADGRSNICCGLYSNALSIDIRAIDGHIFTVTERDFHLGKNWYRENKGNWHTEDGLTLKEKPKPVKEPEFKMPDGFYPVGTKVKILGSEYIKVVAGYSKAGSYILTPGGWKTINHYDNIHPDYLTGDNDFLYVCSSRVHLYSDGVDPINKPQAPKQTPDEIKVENIKRKTVEIEEPIIKSSKKTNQKQKKYVNII
jgi:hypothetical protein